MKVLIITGGMSSEREISFISAKAVKKALEKNNYSAKLFDLKNGYEKLGETSKNFDVLFPVVHGEEGEGGKLHKFLSKLNKQIVGCANYSALEKSWYKIPFKEFCERIQIKTAEWKTIWEEKDVVKFGFPCVLKSSSGGSSKEVFILKSEKGLKNKLCQKLLKSGLPLFVEKYLPGIEVTAAILDGKALPLIEIIPPNGGWFDFKNKYSGKTKEIPNAPSLSEKQRKEIQEIALKIHKTFGLGSYSRIDFIVSKGVTYAIEINIIPGLTSKSLFPKAAQAVGINFPALIKKLVDIAWETGKIKV